MVGRPEIQKFVGALQGQRAHKGVFITTSDFTKDAQEYVKNINTKVVLINGFSASASELLINSLKPHMDVKIVGTPSHGKPVGFPIISVMNYVVAPVAFKTVNSAGEADYYTGFKPDFPEEDDLTKNFGDPNEKCLKVALEYLKTGKVITNSAKSARINASINMESWNDKLPKTFDGMFEANAEVCESIKRILNK